MSEIRLNEQMQGQWVRVNVEDREIKGILYTGPDRPDYQYANRPMLIVLNEDMPDGKAKRQFGADEGIYMMVFDDSTPIDIVWRGEPAIVGRQILVDYPQDQRFGTIQQITNRWLIDDAVVYEWAEQYTASIGFR